MLKMHCYGPVCNDRLLYQKSGVHWCTELCLVLQFDTIDKILYFCPNSCALYYYNSVAHFEINDDNTSSISFIVQDVILNFYFSILCAKKFVGNLIGIVINLQVTFGNLFFFTANPTVL